MSVPPRATFSDDVPGWIEAARQGSAEALGRLLEMCRNYLLMVANTTLEAELQSKASPSDLVQETFLQAQQNFTQFRGSTEAELLGWLRRILLNNAANLSRRFQDTAKRQLAREVNASELAQRTLDAELPADSPLPIDRLAALERDEELRRSLERLPEAYRQVIVWRNFEHLPFDEIGQRLNRSGEAARKLWTRALDELGELLEPPNADSG
ncbi:MAG: sigma-70 family RNA polymerase sigma factor [Gemmataceae bacterium]|nr:sigma-70 family RNA polymerase sigma factor [Gemmataceae bacterium]